MKLKNPLRLALLLALVPAPGIAGPAASNYEKFELTKAEIAAVATATAAKCPKNAGGPKFQASCRAKLMVQSDARLNASYKRTMARLSKPARENLRAMERGWIHERYNECVYLSEDIEANPRPDAAVAIEYNDCALVELKRRTLWLDRYK
jgi:uncharacterized protein YecT (DUF1311 family)